MTSFGNFPLAVILNGVDRLTPALTKGANGLLRFGATAQRVGRNLSLGVSAPILGLAALSLRTAATFELAMKRLQVVSAATAEGMSALEQQALSLGRSSQFSATQVGEAQFFLAQAGFKVNQILALTPAVLNAASAGQMDLGETSDYVTNMLIGYGMAAEEGGRLTDVLTKGANESSTSLQQLGEALKYAGPVASGMNQKLETTVAILGAMGNAGFQAEMGGTALRGSLVRLAVPAANARKVLGRLGISRAQVLDSQGNVRDMVDVVRVLEQSGATTADLMVIFGLRAGPAMAALVKQGADSIEALRATLEGSAGEAARVAAVNMDGATGAARSLAKAFEGLQIAVAKSGLLEWFTEGVRWLTAWVNRVSQSNPELLRMGTLFALAAAAAGPLIFAVGTLFTGMGGLVTVVQALGGAKLLLAAGTKIATVAQWAWNAAVTANPVGLIIVGVAALVGLLVVLAKNWDTVVAAMKTAWNFYVNTWQKGINWLLDMLPALDKLMPDWLRGIVQGDTLKFEEPDVARPAAAAAAASAAPGLASVAGQESHVTVDFTNVPKGTRISTEKNTGGELDLNMGMAMGAL